MTNDHSYYGIRDHGRIKYLLGPIPDTIMDPSSIQPCPNWLYCSSASNLFTLLVEDDIDGCIIVVVQLFV